MGMSSKECREAAEYMRGLAREQDWAEVSHRQVADEWDRMAKNAERDER